MIYREGLIRKLSSYFDIIHFDRAKQDQYYSFIKTKNIDIGRFNGVVLGMIKLETLSDEELFWFASYEETGISVTDYYSPEEITRCGKTKKKEQKEKYPIRFENVIQIAADQWVSAITAKTLTELYNNNILIYNPATQRNPRIRQVGGKPSYQINVNQKSVAQIKDLLARNLFIPNDISLNIRGNYEYNHLTGVLTVADGGLDVIDGFHRLMAVIKLMSQEKDFQLTFVLNLMNFQEEKAKRFIAQQDKRNKINRSFSKTLDNTRYETLIVTRLNENPDCRFYGKIKPFGADRIDSGKMIEAIGYLFSPKSADDVGRIEKEVCDGLSRLVKNTTGFSDGDMRIALCCIKYKNDDFSGMKKKFGNINDIRVLDKRIGGES